jgi:hypothetical protein
MPAAKDNQFAKGSKPAAAQDASKSHLKSLAGTIGSSATSEMTMGRSTVPLDRRGLLMATLGMLAAIPVLALAGVLAPHTPARIAFPRPYASLSAATASSIATCSGSDATIVRSKQRTPPFAHFLDDLAAHEAAKLGDEEAVVADGESPVSSTGVDHIP